MKDWTKTLIRPEQSIRDAIQTINDSAIQIALVVGEHMRLLGTVTDGDVRRGILRGLSLDHPVSEVMNSHPVFVREGMPQDAILALMKKKKLRHIPIVDDKLRLVDLRIFEELMFPPEKDNWVVIMAGGMGTRLRPLTEKVPKPMLEVGGKPLLETIIFNVSQQGFRRFFLAVNYRAEMIKDYFGDGSRFGVEIRYLEEEQPLGTAGALSLLPENPEHPLIVMNGDLLTKINYNHLLQFHHDHEAVATMCVRGYEYQVPYGVVKFDQYRFLAMEEKPVQRFFINAGIYVLAPTVLESIPARSFFDMTDLFQRISLEGRRAIVFPIQEYWLDIGRLEDYARANEEYGEMFL